MKSYSLEENQVKKLFQHLNLEEIITPIKPIEGGLLHKLLFVESKGASYAVKKLNPLIMKRPEAYQNFVFSEDVSRLAKNNGINSVPALMIHNRVVHIHEDGHYMIFSWVIGKTIQNDEVTLIHSKKMGQVLAEIHNLPYDKKDIKKETITEINWTQIEKISKNQTHEWTEQLQTHLETLKNIEKSTRLAQNQHTCNVISHRDLDPKNVMWDHHNNPIIIDWEAAGPVNSELELLELALYWSSGGENKMLFQDVINAYKNIIKVDVNHLKSALPCVFYNKLKWLEYNLNRSLGIESSSDAERDLGTQEVIETLKDILDYKNNIPILEGYLQQLV